MKTLAYLRVSTETQETNNQRLAILEFARVERLEVHEFVELRASSRQSAKVRQIDLLLARLAPGDTLIVSELSRLGRSVGEIITLSIGWCSGRSACSPSRKASGSRGPTICRRPSW